MCSLSRLVVSQQSDEVAHLVFQSSESLIEFEYLAGEDVSSEMFVVLIDVSAEEDDDRGIDMPVEERSDCCEREGSRATSLASLEFAPGGLRDSSPGGRLFLGEGARGSSFAHLVSEPCPVLVSKAG